MRKHQLTFLQTVAVATVLFVLYRVFKSPELDKEINEFEEKNIV